MPPDTAPMTPAPSHPHSATARPLIPTRARRLTVGSLPAPWPEYTPRPDPLPYLRLSGRWLQDVGFAVGAKIRVRVESRRLILEVESDPRAVRTSPALSIHEPDSLD